MEASHVQPTLRRRLALAALATSFFLSHATHHLVRGHWEDLLWTCHLSNLLIAAGFSNQSPTLNAMGVFWLILGVPLWVLDLCNGGEFIVSSALTHIGGLIIGIFGIRNFGFPRQTWWKAFLAFAVVQQLCRFVTPPASNVNVAFSIWPGSERYFSSFEQYRMICLVSILALFIVAEFGMRKLAKS